MIIIIYVLASLITGIIVAILIENHREQKRIKRRMKNYRVNPLQKWYDKYIED